MIYQCWRGMAYGRRHWEIYGRWENYLHLGSVRASLFYLLIRKVTNVNDHLIGWVIKLCYAMRKYYFCVRKQSWEEHWDNSSCIQCMVREEWTQSPTLHKPGNFGDVFFKSSSSFWDAAPNLKNGDNEKFRNMDSKYWTRNIEQLGQILRGRALQVPIRHQTLNCNKKSELLEDLVFRKLYCPSRH